LVHLQRKPVFALVLGCTFATPVTTLHLGSDDDLHGDDAPEETSRDPEVTWDSLRDASHVPVSVTIERERRMRDYLKVDSRGVRRGLSEGVEEGHRPLAL
jgi:hypothetical protein